MTRFVSGLAVVGGVSTVILWMLQAWTVGMGVHTAVQTEPPYSPAQFGVVYLFPHGTWSASDLAAADAEFRRIRWLGVDTIIQTFATGDFGPSYRDGWLAFLDRAAAHGIDVVAYPWPNRVYSGPDEPFDLAALKAFLDVTATHPALAGVIVLHEPLEPQLGISAGDLRALYDELKAYAPQVKIAHYLNNISRAEALRPDDWRFSKGMCDICIIWYYPSIYESGVPVFRITELGQVVAADLALIRERDPAAELWFLGQAFENLAYPTPLRFPTPDEMRSIYEQANQQAIDGLLWYAWDHSDIYGSVLGDDDRTAERDMVRWLAYHYIYRQRWVLPVTLGDSRDGTAGATWPVACTTGTRGQVVKEGQAWWR